LKNVIKYLTALIHQEIVIGKQLFLFYNIFFSFHNRMCRNIVLYIFQKISKNIDPNN